MRRARTRCSCQTKAQGTNADDYMHSAYYWIQRLSASIPVCAFYIISLYFWDGRSSLTIVRGLSPGFVGLVVASSQLSSSGSNFCSAMTDMPMDGRAG